MKGAPTDSHVSIDVSQNVLSTAMITDILSYLSLDDKTYLSLDDTISFYHACVIADICSYLSADEIISFKQDCARCKPLVDSKHIDTLLKPFLNSLKLIDPNLNIMPPKDSQGTPWRYLLFKNSITQIAHQQWGEIKYLKRDLPQINTVYKHLNRHLKSTLINIDSFTIKLSILKARATFLKDLNAELIAIRINSYLSRGINHALNLSYLNLSCIPSQIFSRSYLY